MTFKEQLVLQIANATVIKTGIDKQQAYLDNASEAIVKLADAIIKKMEEK